MSRSKLDPNQIFQHVYDEESNSLRMSMAGSTLENRASASICACSSGTDQCRCSTVSQDNTNPALMQFLDNQKSLLIQHFSNIEQMSKQKEIQIVEKIVHLPVEHKTEIIREVPVERIVEVIKEVRIESIDTSAVDKVKVELQKEIKDNYIKLVKLNIAMFVISSIIGSLILFFK